MVRRLNSKTITNDLPKLRILIVILHSLKLSRRVKVDVTIYLTLSDISSGPLHESSVISDTTIVTNSMSGGEIADLKEIYDKISA